MNKCLNSIQEAIQKTELRDGMTLSFHHHLRNGDYVLNMVMEEIANMGFKDLTLNISSIFDVHEPLIQHIKNGVVTGLETNYMSKKVGQAISGGILDKPVIFRSHGGRAGDMDIGEAKVDIAFIGAPCSDTMGNITGKFGPSACGSLGYAFSDAFNGKKVVVITDYLVDYPTLETSISEVTVDYVVKVDRIGDASRIVSGTTKITKDPVGLRIADLAAKVVKHSGTLKNGFSFQTGAGGISLAVAKCLEEIMKAEEIKGSFCMGGITGYLVQMMKKGYFEKILDVQCFDLEAVESIRDNKNHEEISATRYASPRAKSAAVESLDVVILGATQMDVDFNVNVHTDSNGVIMGGSGGHSDTAFGAKVAIVVAPLIRGRLPLIVDQVICKSTPGETIDVLVTQRGIAVNPKNKELKNRLIEAGLPIKEISELKSIAEEISGKPKEIKTGKKIVGKVLYRDGSELDVIKSIIRD
ncbi:MAG: citrate lyase subunit alpha [Eubacteriaceae bacterium]